ncbi:MAG: S16 family serine protease [Candidatus Nanoarchaeia archaeon]
MKKIIFIAALLVLIFLSEASAEKGHMTLLTVGERGNETFGGTADIYLEVRPGSGRIFIDSFPLTKMDTQISTRFAKEVACDFLEKDCSNKDFFYTIRAKSSVVGGPSAGAALTVLTIAVLENKELNESVVMTGTITSGGIIGPVAGIEDKVDAAKKEGFTKVLIPKRSIISFNETNESLDGINRTNISLTYSDSFRKEGILVVPVSTIEEALFEFTGKNYPDYSRELVVPDKYNEFMKDVSLNICGRAEDILPLVNFETRKNNSFDFNSSLSYLEKGNISFNQGDYYSAASFCFNANKVLRTLEYSQYSKEELLLITKKAKQDIERMLDEVDKKELKTLSELESSMVVKERLFEAKELLVGNDSEVLESLPYIVERIYSAEAWSKFFEYPGKEVELDQDHLSEACLSKIAEAEERINYLDLIFGEREDLREELNDVRAIHESGDYAFCLFKASRIKADASALLTALSITDERFQELLDDQFKLARIQINKQGEDFPIIGYSYYNYASALRETNPELALIYSEYASEFSNLDMYFPIKSTTISWQIDRQQLGIFLIGLASGMFIVILSLYLFSFIQKRKINEKKQALKKKK